MKNIFKLLSDVSNGNKVYIVGGWLRDKLLRKTNSDLDIAVTGDARAFAGRLSRKLGGRLVVLDDKNKVYRIMLKSNPDFAYIDVSALKGHTIENDLEKRDFTVNSIAIPLTGETLDLSKLIDTTGGKKDLKRKLIRMSAKDAFTDDPLRMLRAFRFASDLDFSIEPSTLKQIKKNSALINKSAKERAREELYKILRADNSGKWIAQIDKAGLLEHIFPEIAAMKKSARKFYFHPLGLWQHTLETLICLEEIFKSLNDLFPDSHGRIDTYLNEELSSGVSRRSLLKLVALLHDLAKPSCAKRDGNRMRFIGHDSKGAAMIAEALERIKASRKEIKSARHLVRHHMRPISLGQASVLTSRASARLFRDSAEVLPMLLLLSLADCYSYRRLKVKKAVELKKLRQIIKELFTRYFAEKERTARPKIIDGNILMKKLNLKPGPVIGKLLNAVSLAQMAGEIETKEEALAVARKTLTRYKK